MCEPSRWRSDEKEIEMARYRLLAPHIINNAYHDIGEIIDDTFPDTLNWTPTHAVDPLDADAQQKFWNLRPREMGGAVPPASFGVFGMQVVAPPSVYWRVVNSNLQTYQLTGAGASLGIREGH